MHWPFLGRGVACCRSSRTRDSWFCVSIASKFSCYHRFLVVCDQVESSEHVWINVLEGIGGTVMNNNIHTYLLEKAFVDANVVVGSPLDDYDVFVSWASNVQDCSRNVANDTVCSRFGKHSETCLIYLEQTFENLGMSRLAPCGHCVCVDCWVDYIKSTAESGYPATIQCPSHKCETSIDLLDAAHLFFHDNKNEDKAAAIF